MPSTRVIDLRLSPTSVVRTMSDDTKASKSTTSDPSSSSAPESSSSPSSSPSEGGKSAKEAIGGAKTGHYGYFSNIKTPEYKSGWDDIWGKKKKKPAKRKKAALREPVAVEIGIDDLPEDAQAALADAAKEALKGRRISYYNRAKKGDVSWSIMCEVKR